MSFPHVSAHINAGGRGTRLQSNYERYPDTGVSKAMLEVGSRPRQRLINHQIAFSRSHSLRPIMVDVGDHDHLVKYIQDATRGSDIVVPVSHEQQLGTGGDLVRTTREFAHMLGALVLVQNVDTILDINIRHFIETHQRSGTVATIALTQLNNVPNEGAYHVANGHVTYSREADSGDIHAPHDYRASSTGAVIFNRSFIEQYPWQPENGSLSIYSDMLGSAIRDGQLAAYDNGHNFFIDVGTPAALAQANDPSSYNYVQHYLYR